MSPIAQFDQLDSPYHSTTAERLGFGAEPALLEYVDALRAFVGPKSEYYLRKWSPRLRDPKADVGINWAAFFLTGLWFGYRRMIKAALLVYAAMIALWLAQVGVFMFTLGMPRVPPLATLIVNLMVCTTCGAFANSWYLAKATRTIAAARAQGVVGDHLAEIVAPHGGTSVRSAIGLAFAPLGVLLALFLTWMFILAIYAHAP